MKFATTISSASLLALLAATATGQVPAAADFQLTKIIRNFRPTPEYNVPDAEHFEPNERGQWLEVEVQFSATPAYTNELTFRYYILIAGKLLTGEVTHINIPGGRERRSVMYVAPHTLSRLLDNRAAVESSIANIGVQLLEAGTVKSEVSFARAQPGWFARMPALSGLVLNKNETPFAPLYWDRYEQIKIPAR